MTSKRGIKIQVINLYSENITNKWIREENRIGLNVAIYTRQSTPHQATLDEQLRDCCMKARDLGYQNAYIFSDKGSAWKQNCMKTLYGLQHLFRCIKLGYITEIIVYDISRLSRNMEMGIKMLSGIKAYQLKVHSLLDQSVFTSHPKSCNDFLRKILEAQEYSTNLSLRISDKVRHLKSKGFCFGSPRYGMESFIDRRGIRKFRTNKYEIEIIKKIKNKLTKRQTYEDIAEWLNNNGYLKRDHEWNPTMVRYIATQRLSTVELIDSLPLC